MNGNMYLDVIAKQNLIIVDLMSRTIDQYLLPLCNKTFNLLATASSCTVAACSNYLVQLRGSQVHVH